MVVLVAMRCTDPGVGPIPLSRRVPCLRCGEEVWLAPSGLRMLASGKVVVMCSACMPGREAVALPPTPEQILEVQSWLTMMRGN